MKSVVPSFGNREEGNNIPHFRPWPQWWVQRIYIVVSFGYHGSHQQACLVLIRVVLVFLIILCLSIHDHSWQTYCQWTIFQPIQMSDFPTGPILVIILLKWLRMIQKDYLGCTQSRNRSNSQRSLVGSKCKNSIRQLEPGNTAAQVIRCGLESVASSLLTFTRSVFFNGHKFKRGGPKDGAVDDGGTEEEDAASIHMI